MRRIVPAAACAAICLTVLSGAFAQEPQTPSASLELLTSDTTVSADGSSVQTIHSELRATNEGGAMQVSRIDLPFNTGMQTIEVLEAYTLKPNGNKIPVDLNTVFEQLPPDAARSGMVTDQRVKVLFFPQFSAGDEAVYTVRIASPHPHFPGAFFNGEIFPRSVPYKEVRETVTAPKSMALRVENHTVTFSKAVNGDNVVYTWHYAAPAAKKIETSFVSPIDREPRYFISSFKDYAELGRAYAALAQPKIVVTDKIKALAGQITGAEPDRREQARKLYEWVVHNIRYVAIELGHGSFVPHEVDAILANGYGDCKDHDVLLQALLKARGITADSVLINSSNAYSLTDAPTFAQLDHVITFVPEFDIYLDASVPVAPFGTLPTQEYGKPAIRISAQTAVLTTTPLLKPATASMHTTTVQKLEASGTMSGTTTTTATGPYAITLRMIGFAVQAVGAEKAAAMQLASRGFKDGTGKLSEDPPTVLSPSYTIRGDFAVKGWQSLLGGEATIMPGGLRVLVLTGDGIMGPVYGSADTNAEPTPCYSATADEDVTLEVPQGYSVREVPKDTKITTPNLSFTAHWSWASQKLTVHREFASHIGEALCTGNVRKQTADALKDIAESYDITFTIANGSQTSLAPQNATPDAATDTDIAAYNVANAAIKRHDYKQAEALLLGLLQTGHSFDASQTYDIHVLLGEIYTFQDQNAKAEEHYAQALNLKPDADAGFHYWRAYNFKKLGKLSLADDNAVIAMKRDPDNAAARTLHANISEERENFAAAADDYDVLLRMNNNANNLSLVLQRAEARALAHRYEEAAADYEHAEKLGASTGQTLDGLCTTLVHTARFAEGIYQCSRALQIHENSGALLEARGFGYVRQSKYAAALADFDQAARVFPQNARYLYERGTVKTKMGDSAGGQKDIAKATQMRPDVAHQLPAAMRS